MSGVKINAIKRYGDLQVIHGVDLEIRMESSVCWLAFRDVASQHCCG